jgi:hypothetical protein
MTRKNFGALGALLVAALLAGCATSRSEVKLASPGAESAAAAPTTGRVVVIRNVTDERIFQDKPSEPSTPSLGGDGASKSAPEVKARAIGRKRNTYGMALGDVLLEPGRTVEGTVRENLAAAFRQAGFQVRDSATAGALVVDARIRRFWSWITPGFFAVTLQTVIETDLAAPGHSANVNVVATNSSMAPTDGVWIESVDKALQQYREQAASKVSGWR